MMKKLVVIAAALLLSAGVAEAKTAKIANPVTPEQKAEFYKVCMGIAQNDQLCSCKAEAATKLIDTEFMTVVIAAMKGKSPPDSAYDTYDDYIFKSNQICKPTYM
ncbi:MAG: hypothetical protein ABL879_03965 [Devosia sp.]